MLKSKDPVHINIRNEYKKDRGDNLKRTSKPNGAIKYESSKDLFLEQGDSATKSNKGKLLTKTKNQNEVESKIFNKSAAVVSKRKIVEGDKPVSVNRLLDINEKRKIREKYTIKPNQFVGNKKMDSKNKLKNSPTEVINDNLKKHNHGAGNKEKSNEHIKSENNITDKSSDSKENARKRPVIRTVTAKNDATKVYKAITFTEQKRKAITPLQIKIPTDALMKTFKIHNNDDNESRSSNKSKLNKTKNEKKRRNQQGIRDLSPEPMVKDLGSPPTEVAKWAPSSVNKHTKPYYEAWVDTTLAAISKNSKKDKLFLEKHNLIHTFKRILEQRPESPELVYENYMDERYTGRIKINHK